MSATLLTPSTATVESTDVQPDASTGSCRVLIVDDSAVTRAMVARSVTLSGVEAELEQAADGVVALERLRADRFDVCFLDLNMPRMGGLEVAQAVQADEAIATHVVVVSSEAMAGRIEQLQSSGVAGYIRKPFTPTQIRDVLLRLVPHRAAA